MMIVNEVSRYHIAIESLKKTGRCNGVVEELHRRLKETREYILRTGEDPEGTYDTPKFE